MLFGYTALELVAYICSRVSVIGWVLAGIYQLWLGYKSQGDIGFSPIFLAGYVFGDICNVFGCFWGEQMAFQKVIVVATLSADSLMALQYAYYKRRANGRNTRINVPTINPSTALVGAAMFGISHAQQLDVFGSKVAPPPPQMEYKFLIGQVMAWVAQISYVSGVIPQVFRNFSKKCTGGVSKFLFVADLIGSVGYIATLAATAQSLDKHESVQFLFDELAYLLGTSACLVLDLVLMVQYIIYPEFPEQVIEVLDGQQPQVSHSIPAAKEYGACTSR